MRERKVLPLSSQGICQTATLFCDDRVEVACGDLSPIQLSNDGDLPHLITADISLSSVDARHDLGLFQTFVSGSRENGEAELLQ